ncbi:MAG TPA: DUF4105 domain-containing protein, partial [Gemmatimonadales bacterium]|nr:DUF4105 domain-containing protein [Gemmatimonadales bacterium]
MATDKKRVTWILLGVIAVVLVGTWAFLNPSHDRNWSPEQKVLANARFNGDSVHLSGVRNFEWNGDTTFAPRWEEGDYDLGQVATAWYILAPFSRSWRGPAHSFVSFGFDDGRYLALSVEARREQGEIYGVVSGMLRRFELIYVVGTEHDLIGRRAATGRDQLYLYPIKAERTAIRQMLTGMLQRVNKLYEQPEFYNTLTNNCTLNLVRHVNQVAPDLIPSASWRIALPGYSDVVAYNLGLIDSTLPI